MVLKYQVFAGVTFCEAKLAIALAFITKLNKYVNDMCTVDFSAQEQWLVSKSKKTHVVWFFALHSTVVSEHLLSWCDRASLHGTSLGSGSLDVIVFAKSQVY